jgi:hypothetical protein
MRRKNDISEAVFWKHLADTLLENAGIDKSSFYKKIKPIKYVWDIKDINKISEEIRKATQDKTQYIKSGFSEVLYKFKNNRVQ